MHNGVVIVRHTRVTRRAFCAHGQPARALLGSLNRIKRLARDRHREAAKLTKCVFGAQQIGMLIYDLPDAFIGACFFIGGCGDDDVALQRHLTARDLKKNRHLHGADAFHIYRATPVHVAVFDLCAKWLHRPFVTFDRHDIGVRVEQQRLGVAVAFDARDDVAAIGRGLDDGRLDLMRAQDVGEIARGDHFVAGRVAGVEADKSLQDVNCL